MSDIDDLLAEINAEQREFEQTMWSPASPDAIVRLRRLAWDALRTDLPEDHGDTGDQFCATSRAWVALDRHVADVIATFPSLDAMLTKVLRDAVAE